MSERFQSHPPCEALYRSGQLGPNGGRLCRYCGAECPRGRKSWCSKRCVAAWRQVGSGSGLRAAVRARDRGVCDWCGTDCPRLERMLRALLNRLGEWAGNAVVAIMDAHGWRGMFEREVVVRDGVLRRRWGVRSAWQADHVLAVADGGGGTDRRNVRTLCRSCHRERTSKQAGDRAKAKRADRRKTERDRIKKIRGPDRPHGL